MKNFLLLTAMLWTAFACAEGENLLYNGDFEKKGTVKAHCHTALHKEEE